MPKPGRPAHTTFSLSLRQHDAEKLQSVAESLNLSSAELIYKLITICIDDNLFSAILDKDEPCQTKPSMKPV